MKNFSLNLFVFLISILTFSSCSFAYKVLLGVDVNPNLETESEIQKQANRYHIYSNNHLTLDTIIFFKEIKKQYAKEFKKIQVSIEDSSEYHSLKRKYKDDYQPVQFRLFYKNGKELFKLVNCYVDPPIPMNWNVDGCFDSFPPKTEIESLNSHLFDLNFFLQLSSKENGEKLTKTDLPESDYYGVILWNNILKRPSRKLIKTVNEYISVSGKSVEIIYINNHNSYLIGSGSKK